jgi:hypothetical protein
MFLYKYNFFLIILLLFVSFGQFCLTVKGTAINDHHHHHHHADDDEARKE